MHISARDKKLVFESWGCIKDQEAAGIVWFARLMEQYPHMKDLYSFLQGYSGDPMKHHYMPSHAGRVMRKLDIAVNQLVNDTHIMVDDLQTLGSRHPGYGVNPFKHVSPTLDALVFMLRQQLGAKFTAEVEDAWRRFFRLIVEAMGLIVH